MSSQQKPDIEGRLASPLGKKVAILQSNYIPWKGYFDIINSVDEFILYDDMQYTRRDWRNRNKIVTRNGLQWLTVPVEARGKFLQKINETKISDFGWCRKHWSALVHNYKKAPFFSEYEALFESLYLGCREAYLSRLNYAFILEINRLLGIQAEISFSSDYDLLGDKSEKLLGICRQAGAAVYLSGPSARNYLDEELFRQENIRVEWMDYDNYPIYPQLFGSFEHGVTILDLIFNTGSDARVYMKSFGE